MFSSLSADMSAMKSVMDQANHYKRSRTTACRRSLQVVLVQRGDQAIDARLLDLLGELVAVVLNQPDVLDIDVVDLPALGCFLETVIDAHGRAVAAGHERADHHVVGVGVAAEGLDID